MNFKKVILAAIVIGFLDQKASPSVGLFTPTRIHYTTQKEMEKVISLLCQKFKMRNNITIKILDKGLGEDFQMCYYSNIDVIAVGHNSQKKPLSVVYATLLHEFRHYMQSKHKVLERRTGKEKIKIFYDQKVLEMSQDKKQLIWFLDDIVPSIVSAYGPKNKDEKKYVQDIENIYKKYPDSLIFKPAEFDAELFKIQNTTCPICYEILLQTKSRTNVSPEGYVGVKYMNKYRQEKQQNPCCKAHSCNDDVVHNKKVKELRQLLYGPVGKASPFFSHLSLADKEKICDFDNQCGKLSDRHSK